MWTATYGEIVSENFNYLYWLKPGEIEPERIRVEL